MCYIKSYTVANRYADSDDRFFTNGNSPGPARMLWHWFRAQELRELAEKAYKDPAAFTNSITYARCNNIALTVAGRNKNKLNEWVE